MCKNMAVIRYWDYEFLFFLDFYNRNTFCDEKGDSYF